MLWTSSSTARNFSNRTVKISHRVVNLMPSMQNINKNLQFSPCGKWLMINCLYSVGGFTARRGIFTLRWDKSLAVRNEAANTILFKHENEIEILKFKILQRIIKKFPAIQWNRPNVILFHETIPLTSFCKFLQFLTSFMCFNFTYICFWKCVCRVKLECEREHQEHLLLSVMPAYIAAEVIPNNLHKLHHFLLITEY
jgi:hypothetical protein